MNTHHWDRWVMQTARTWNDLSPVIRTCGLDRVDDDNRRMVEYALEINSLIELVRQPHLSMETLKREGRFLIDFYNYAIEHFEREEAILKQYRLPDIETHRRLHADILGMMKSTISQFEAGQINITQALKLSVIEWVVTHINEIDYETFKVENWSWLLETCKTWDDLAVFIRQMGIDEIDRQHRELTVDALEICHVLETAEEGMLTADFTVPFFESFKMLLVSHFKYEEDFIKRNEIEGLTEQCSQHQGILELFTDAGDYSTLSAGVFARAVLSWWVNHINDTDYNTFCRHQWQQSSLERACTIDEIIGLVRSTGYTVLDLEHRELIQITVSLNTIQENPENIIGILEKLLQTAGAHFSNEEHFMERTGYPNLSNHRKEHQRLLATLHESVVHFRDGRIGAIADLRVRMLDWVVTHTNGYDYDTFIRSGFFSPEATP